MTPNEYQQAALRTEATKGASTGKRLLHAAMGCATETGELTDMLKKSYFYGKEIDRVNVLEECGDLLWYISVALDAAGYSMDSCMERNIAKLRARFPDKFTEEQALHRDLDAERKTLEDE